MSLPAVFEPFVRQSPWAVMVRGVLERAFSDQVFDTLFRCFARDQHCRKLLFSTCVDLMVDVVTRVQPSLGASIRNKKQLLPVRTDCIYRKIAGLEDDVVTAAVAVTADDLASVVDEVGGALPALVPGTRTLVLDANHLRAVQHRIKPLQGLRQAALPGTAVAILDADRRLFIEIFLLQDGHASEMQVLAKIPPRLKANDLILADRGFCNRDLAAGIEDRQAFFLLRQHATRFPLKLLGEREFAGEIDSGRVYEQLAQYRAGDTWRTVRRITVELHQPTRNKDKVLHLLSNLPQEVIDPATGQAVAVTAVTIAEGYRQRWTIETAFHALTVQLNCELDTLAYPPAALFGFCVAAMCYNAYSAAMGAVRGHYGAQRAQQEFSSYYMANDVRAVWTGMHIAIPENQWTAVFGGLTLPELAAVLLNLASQIDPKRYQKAKTRPHPPPKKGSTNRARAKHTSVMKELKKHKPDAST